ncbi:amidohydrolase [Neobittarella massiliensis]|uniref:Amidohydrolase n=1 Tax=Neobittarella massiliensis (ex Bilen et al. 2018) TaxID=2041842 RepID=A0A8J6M0V1_9FIRM|nr:amidohydrolase [Neobittarella massiliensis]MBC3515131.1 amidohydrolase [Neobittarella massiliensis]
MLFISAHLHTMEARDYPCGYLRTRGTKIHSLGDMGELDGPLPGEQVIDLQGAHMYPGFVDAHSHLGMWGNGLGFEGADGNEESDPATPHLRAIDAVNHADYCFAEALAGGVTTAVTGPGSANAIGGQLCAVKTRLSRIDTGMLSPCVAIKFALGENPKTVYNDKDMAPITRMATAAIIREQLFRAKRYMEDVDRAGREGEELPEYDIKCEALLPLLRRQMPAHFHAHRADDIFTALRLCREFGLRCVIVHGTEGHLIADILAAEQVPVITGPILCDRSKPELVNLTPKNPGILAAAGVPCALCTDHPVTPIQYLPLTAGLAVREGMDRQQALRAITIGAASICGIADRVGSLAPGKDADLAVFDGDPLSNLCRPRLVTVDGQIVNEI